MTRNLCFLVVVFNALFFVLSCAWSDKRAHEPCYDIRSPKTGGNWTTEGSAQIRSGSKGRNADGFGLFYVRDPENGPTFGTIPEFVGLGIVFDTYRNGVKRSIEPPFLQAHVLNGSVPHEWKEDGYPSALVSIHAPLIEKSNAKLIVRYQDNALAVTLKYKEVNATEWPKKEFRIQDVNLPRGYHFGIGAACGGHCSNHRVLGLRVHSFDGPEHNSQDLTKVNSDEMSQGNEYVRWNRFTPETVSYSAVVLGYTVGARPVFFARVVDKGRTSPALYIPSLNKDNVYAFPDDQVTIVEAKDAQILSYRYSRSSHLLWQRYPTKRLESKGFIDRLAGLRPATLAGLRPVPLTLEGEPGLRPAFLVRGCWMAFQSVESRP